MSWQDVQFHNTVVITLKALSDTDDMLYLYWGIGYNEPDNELYTDIQNIRLLSGKFITYEFSVKTRWLKIVSPNTVIESICYKSAPTSIRLADNKGHVSSVHHGDVSSGLCTILVDLCGKSINTSHNLIVSDVNGSALYTTLCDSSGIPLSVVDSKLCVALVDSNATAIGTTHRAMNVAYTDASGRQQAFTDGVDVSVAAGTVAGFYSLCDNCGKPIDTTRTTSAVKNSLCVTLTDDCGRLISDSNPLYLDIDTILTFYTIDTSVGGDLISLVNINDKVDGTCFNINTLSIYNSLVDKIWVKFYDVYNTLGALPRFDLFDQTLKLNIAVPPNRTRAMRFESGLLFYHGCMVRASKFPDYNVAGNLNVNGVYIYGSYNKLASLDGRSNRPTPVSHTASDTIKLFDHSINSGAGVKGWLMSDNTSSVSVALTNMYGFNNIGTLDMCINILSLVDVSIGSYINDIKYQPQPLISDTLYTFSLASGNSNHYKALFTFSSGGTVDLSLCVGLIYGQTDTGVNSVATFTMDSSFYGMMTNKGSTTVQSLDPMTLVQYDQYDNDTLLSVSHNIQGSKDLIVTNQDATNRYVFINSNCTIADICLNQIIPYIDNKLILKNNSNVGYFSISAAIVDDGKITVSVNDKLLCYSTSKFRGNTMYVNTFYNTFIHSYSDSSIVTAYADNNKYYYDNIGNGSYSLSDVNSIRIYIDGSVYDSSGLNSITKYPKFCDMSLYIPPTGFQPYTYSYNRTYTHIATTMDKTYAVTDNSLYAIDAPNVFVDISSNFLLPGSLRCSYDGSFIAICYPLVGIMETEPSIGLLIVNTHTHGVSHAITEGIDDIAISYSGKYMIAAPSDKNIPIYSTNYGASFNECSVTPVSRTASWLSAISRDGRFMAAINSSDINQRTNNITTAPRNISNNAPTSGALTGALVLSSNYGTTWSRHDLSSTALFSNMLCSYDGTKLLLSSSNEIYSIDVNNYTAQLSSSFATDILSMIASDNLDTLAVSISSGTVLINHNYGIGNWNSYSPSLDKLAMSADGRLIYGLNDTSLFVFK